MHEVRHDVEAQEQVCDSDQHSQGQAGVDQRRTRKLVKLGRKCVVKFVRVAAAMSLLRLLKDFCPVVLPPAPVSRG